MRNSVGRFTKAFSYHYSIEITTFGHFCFKTEAKTKTSIHPIKDYLFKNTIVDTLLKILHELAFGKTIHSAGATTRLPPQELITKFQIGALYLDRILCYSFYLIRIRYYLERIVFQYFLN